jgi:tetratricopeptide (TPR) repeat protein
MKNRNIFCFLLLSIAASVLSAQERPDALQLYKQGNYARAAQVCMDEIKELPRNMNSYVVLGWSFLKLGRYQEALDYGKTALGISRYDNRILQIMAEANYNLGNNVESLKYLEEYATISPTGDLIDEVYYLMGEIFVRLGEFRHADVAFTTAVFHDPKVAVWWSRLGYAREQAKDFKYALDAYNKALQLNPNLGDAVRGRQRVQAIMNLPGGSAPPSSGSAPPSG